ncbi:MAG TPA: ComEC/Rec2 family competence protein [Candidatus Limnocylindrales bacterium]|nr:ComEC/Rec2 family competence protein [Candidatus Limnocylindrales bacterium]
MTASGWLAIGSILASLAAPQVGSIVVAVVAAGLACAAVGARGEGRPSSRDLGRCGAAVAAGGLLIGVRLLALPADDLTAASSRLPEGRGPWTATVETISPARDGQQVATLRLLITEPNPPAELVVAATLPRYPPIEPANRVTVEGSIEPPPDGPYGEYLRRIGVDGTLRSRSLALAQSGEPEPPSLERVRRAAGAALAAAIPEPEAGLAAGIVIGLRDRVDRDLAADFTTVGASHVVAISGWNIAIVAATVAALLGRFGRRRRSIVLVVAIVAYVLFAGASASVVRAAAMAGVVLLARETGRAGRAAAALGWAAALLLIADPGLVSDAGFQLSSLATAGILAWANRLQTGLGRVGGGRLPTWLVESLAVSLAAQAATLPVVLLAFGRLAIISPAINLLIVPLVAPAMAAALIALLGGAVALAGGPAIVATLAGLPAWALLTAMCTVIRAGAALPFASVTLAPPWTILAALAAAGIPFAVIAVAGRPRRGPVRRARIKPPSERAGGRQQPKPAPPRFGRLAAVALAIAVGSLGLAAAHRADGSTRITVLDVGQGDSILVEGGRGARMLIDGGPDPDRLLVELDRRLPPWDRRIDILVLTHPHEDHVAGMPLLLERYRIGRIYETGMRGPGPGYAAFARDLVGRAAPPHATLATGAQITLDEVRFHVLWPDPGRVPREPPDAGRGINDVSIVLLGEVAGRRFLLTGDVEDDVDPVLVARGLPPIDVLKVAHHGSATASTPAFLDAVRPAVAIVSAGAGNPYGHPARSTIERLSGTGARVLRTDTDGTVEVSIDPAGAIAVSTTGARRVAATDAGAVALTLGSRAAKPTLLAPPTFAFSCGIPSGG